MFPVNDPYDVRQNLNVKVYFIYNEITSDNTFEKHRLGPYTPTYDDEKGVICEFTLDSINSSNMTSSYGIEFEWEGFDNHTILDVDVTYLENSGDLVQPDLNRNDKDYYNQTIKSDYSEKQEGVRDSLIARLDVIKGELWYRQSYGLPLLEKIKSKGIYDSIIVGYIMDQPDVVNIEEFSSSVNGHTYEFTCVINTVYNEKITLSTKI